MTPVSARLTRCLKPRCCRDAMLRIGPTYYNHTPYARVHNAFLPLFEDAIRLHRCLGRCKVKVFWDVSRLRIVLSSDANMADGTCNERRVSRQQISSPERPKEDRWEGNQSPVVGTSSSRPPARLETFGCIPSDLATFDRPANGLQS